MGSKSEENSEQKYNLGSKSEENSEEKYNLATKNQRLTPNDKGGGRGVEIEGGTESKELDKNGLSGKERGGINEVASQRESLHSHGSSDGPSVSESTLGSGENYEKSESQKVAGPFLEKGFFNRVGEIDRDGDQEGSLGADTFVPGDNNQRKIGASLEDSQDSPREQQDSFEDPQDSLEDPQEFDKDQDTAPLINTIPDNSEEKHTGAERDRLPEQTGREGHLVDGFDVGYRTQLGLEVGQLSHTKSDFELRQPDQINTGESLQEEQVVSSLKETFDSEESSIQNNENTNGKNDTLQNQRIPAKVPLSRALNVKGPHTGEVSKSNEESRASAEDELEINTSLDQDLADRVQESSGITSSSNKKGSLRSNTKVQPKNLLNMSKENSTTLDVTTEKTLDNSSETKHIGRLSSSGRPRSLGQVNDQLLVNRGIEEVNPDIKEVDTNKVTGETEDKSAIESRDEERKDDAKKTKKGGSSLVAALPDKSGRI